MTITDVYVAPPTFGPATTLPVDALSEHELAAGMLGSAAAVIEHHAAATAIARAAAREYPTAAYVHATRETGDNFCSLWGFTAHDADDDLLGTLGEVDSYEFGTSPDGIFEQHPDPLRAEHEVVRMALGTDWAAVGQDRALRELDANALGSLFPKQLLLDAAEVAG